MKMGNFIVNTVVNLNLPSSHGQSIMNRPGCIGENLGKQSLSEPYQTVTPCASGPIQISNTVTM